MSRICGFLCLFFLLLHNFSSAEEVLDELKIKRKNVFEFDQEPSIVKEGDKVTISFSVKDFCDVTVSVQTAEGDIIRHLASGVLGKNAPDPFQKDSLAQAIVWDSKDDQGAYRDDLGNMRIRVALGLKPEYEKDIYTTPYKMISAVPAITCGPEGLYVFEGVGRDHLVQFSHSGEYIKTIYPFPASKIDKVKGLVWWSYGNREKIPQKNSYYHQTLLTSGDHGFNSTSYFQIMGGKGATTISVQGNRMIMAYENVNRVLTDGSTGEFNLNGPRIGIDKYNPGYGGFGKGKEYIGPASSAFSPDGKTVYFTGIMWKYDVNIGGAPPAGSLQCVRKMNYESDDAPVVFVGSDSSDAFGLGANQLNTPSSVDTDANGNVYVADFWNNRVQIFNPNGELLKSLPTAKPATVLVHKKNGEIYVFSYGVEGVPAVIQREAKYDSRKVEKTLSVFSPYPEMKALSKESFPLDRVTSPSQIALDSWSKTPAIWLAQTSPQQQSELSVAIWGRQANKYKEPWLQGMIKLERIDGQWKETDNFGARAAKDIARPKPPAWNIQQLYFNPKNKKLYIGEADSGPTTKAFTELLEVDPEIGTSKVIRLPFNPMDIAFDLDGYIYMRTMAVLARYDLDTWKEVPFDYGAEKAKVGEDGGIGGASAAVISAIMLPATNAVCYHQGGMDVNIRGDIIVACHNRATMEKNAVAGRQQPMQAYNTYKPYIYPGRLLSSTSVCLHIWDKHGALKMDDVVPGSPQTDGVFLDKDYNVYMLATNPRTVNGKPLDDGMTSTLFKFKAKKGSFVSTLSAEVALSKDMYPDKAQEIKGLWAINQEWQYGGVGFGGFNASALGGGCACWFARFKLDYFARSIVPEPVQYSVAVLDANGNLITRIGRYGNLDSAGPKSKEPLGGDEVGLFHPCFVATHTDKRIFISDIGNERIVSVKLNYYQEKILMVPSK